MAEGYLAIAEASDNHQHQKGTRFAGEDVKVNQSPCPINADPKDSKLICMTSTTVEVSAHLDGEL